MSISSGSCGNCYILKGDTGKGIIIDAGVSLRRLKRALAGVNLSVLDFAAVIVTHDHLDHIRHLGPYCKTLALPVYATDVLHRALAKHTFTRDYIPGCRRILPEGEWTEVVPGFEVRWFEVPHDATQTVGFVIRGFGHLIVHITDCGKMTPEALEWAREADTVTVESNFDIGMLMAGPYTEALKMRICRGYGHLSNDGCADAIRAFVHDGLKTVFLCHLSENNNTPDLAYESARQALREAGRTENDVFLRTLPRQYPSPLFTL